MENSGRFQEGDAPWNKGIEMPYAPWNKGKRTVSIEERREYQRKYQLENKERIKERKRQRYLEENGLWERTQERKKKWYTKNIDRCRQRNSAKAATRNAEVKRVAFDHYSGGTNSCKHCGVSDIDVLSIDHINNNGAEHRRKIADGYKKRGSGPPGGGIMFYNYLIKNQFPEGYQVLCFNCNIKKEILRRRSLRGQH